MVRFSVAWSALSRIARDGSRRVIDAGSGQGLSIAGSDGVSSDEASSGEVRGQLTGSAVG